MIDAPPLTRRPLLWWDVGIAGLALVLCIPGGAGALDWSDTAEGWGGRLALNLGVLAAFVLLYVVLGRGALLRGICDEQPTGRSFAYLASLVLVLGVATAVEPSYASLQALAHPITWIIVVRYRNAIIWSALLASAVGIGSGIAYVRVGIEDPIWTALVIAGISFGFSVILGTWITRIFAQSERYRAIADELRRTQREVAALSTEAGAAQERERLSRELHDTLTQTLAGLVMLSEQATRAFDAGDQGRARDRLERVESAAREAVAEARALVATTQPLGDGGLEAAIARVASRMRADTGLAIDCVIEPVALDREAQVVLLRAAQEGLANARKHARATRVDVTLSNEPNGGAHLSIADDGVGPGDLAHADGFGLSGLAERVRAVGGEVQFGPGQRGGALLQVRLPGSGGGAA
ncbi:sensor histidine kinase [Leucobacter salsicius]|uniref:sensor histidine kinase n=1 Tax=Leucobacter salsicius TaxID=664638 RepID=UPI0003474479|nr:sensor histidine kinase [Leucobacter salsicius]